MNYANHLDTNALTNRPGTGPCNKCKTTKTDVALFVRFFGLLEVFHTLLTNAKKASRQPNNKTNNSIIPPPKAGQLT